MSDSKSPQNLSMDEILATIRRIIAEDEQASAATVRAVPAHLPPGREAGETRETVPASAPELAASDVLDLTDALNEDGSVRHLVPPASVPHTPEAGAAIPSPVREPMPAPRPFSTATAPP